jgi:hypothetical protein
MPDNVPVFLLLTLLSLVYLVSFESRKPIVLPILFRVTAGPFRCVFTKRRLLVLGALLCLGGLACGGIRWYQTLGRIHETHAVDDYRFRITSELDPECDDITELAEDVSISVSHRGKVLAKQISIGSIDEVTRPPTFSVCRLPNDSLVVVIPDDRSRRVVFAYDTATGVCYPEPYAEDWRERYEESKQRCAAFEARIRACSGFEQHELRGLWASDRLTRTTSPEGSR